MSNDPRGDIPTASKIRAHPAQPMFIRVSLLLLAVWFAPAAVHAQSPPTPTPNADGLIIVTVQPGETLWGIAARAGIPLADLLALNNLDENALIQPGQPLLIGIGTPPPTPTVPHTPTPTRPPPPPTNTPLPPPRTAVCILAFTDLNMNGVQDAGEPLKSGVAFTIYNETAVVENYITTGNSEPHCLENVPSGDYRVTRSVGRDETLTTNGNWAIELLVGEVVNLAFGSYTSSDAIVISNPPTPTTSPASTADDIAPGAETGSDVPLKTMILVMIGAGVLFLAGWRLKMFKAKKKSE